MTHTLITGGAGFIGSHLAEALLERGEEVTVIDDLSTGRFENIEPLTKNPGFSFALETITNETVMDRLGSECDRILHLAAAVGVQLIVNDPVRTIETNVMGSEAVLRVARRYRRKVFLASSSEVYGKNNKVPFREDDDGVFGATTVTRWAYATSKALDEFLALAYHRSQNLPVVIGRFFNTVGPRQSAQYGMVIPRFVRQALAGEPITVYDDGLQSRCFCNVRDVVRAILLLIENPAAEGQVFNIGSTEEIGVRALAETVKKLTGSSSEIKHISYQQAYDGGFEDMRQRVPDIQKIRRVTGWKPEISLAQTLDEIIGFFRRQPKA
ncbi:MAG: GDP-mannose 4,6-dehydratase [Anaerolineales bacterium]|nr:GDP-mannose 4,6-dehydratase [Anaerolineales bacterium]